MSFNFVLHLSLSLYLSSPLPFPLYFVFHLSSMQLSDYRLMSVLTCYTVVLPSEQNLPVEEAYHLATVALGTWQVLLSYGLSDEAFR